MNRRARIAGLLALPMTWLIGIYIFSLVMLLVTAFWVTDPFTSKVKPGFTLRNFEQLITNPAYLTTSVRTLAIALGVTALAIAISIPLGIFMAKVASPWLRAVLAVSITLPLWAGYLVKVIAMRITFTQEGFFNWLVGPLGIEGPGFSTFTVVLTLTYLWLPYMAVPVYTAIRQLPPNLFDAAADLGAGAWRTIRTVVLPLIKPAVIAGSVFTFSLSLGDYLVAKFVGGDTQMIGSVIASNINLNPPLAAAFSLVPIAFVVIYLVSVQRTGALERM
ncbi:ABC transporter permease [Microbacterium esteraromaticum]|uniref:ABC transporter permease n=1 Tax=Microbacterium esteraromaticum TaxID=57043 RepID=A0A939DVV5_9MICO|nr:ABC transporter permease [Microbacterium esteraromaticum]MBN7792869.1 ABC transporter permease [Microbacterium esteraromaticum]MBN8205861.1 ABC transporter permease [Microbacterium esteraromaticum]MBN8416016.1 ABC transporter permease [Microbacterium esteraromaticum]MBY6060833.1 ABC transporter permease [Microbacterium esteraromaticum]MCA1306022.1 ABC transporter permease [Microbacterium esteraromaticum]